MRIIFTILTLIILGGLSLNMSACSKDKVPAPALNTDCPDTVSYQSFVRPLIMSNCTTSGCHDASSAGGYVLETHTQISANADIILNAIRHTSGISQMPQGQPKLADSLATKLNCWIIQGKLDN
jgi:hypothetical protein